MVLRKYNLEGKVAIVTGASRGIGKAIALGLASAGAKVVVASRRLPDLELVAKEIGEKGGEALPVVAHMRHKEDITILVNEAMKRFGRIDILVNNAATNPVFSSILDMEEKAWDQVMEVNLKGYFLLSQAVAKIMVNQKGGTIINISSRNALSPTVGLGAYAISKAGVAMLTKVMAKELGKYGIRVNALAPGLIQTRFSEALWADDERRKRAEENTPLGRLGQPEDMAGAVVFLASEASNYLTGQVLLIDGGVSI